MDMANWQNYRSQVNGMPAVFTANIEDLDVYHVNISLRLYNLPCLIWDMRMVYRMKTNMKN